MESIKEILMRRDKLCEREASEIIEEARHQLRWYLADGDLESAEDICEEFFGLEPDYIYELF